MIKQGKEILQFIKTENKISSQKVKDIQTQINQCVYEHNLGYLSPVSASTLCNQFIELGKELNEVEVTEKQKSHKNECLIQLRTNCRNLQRYAKQPLEETDKLTVEKMMKFQIYTFLKDNRDGLLTTQRIMEHLMRSDDIYRNLVIPIGIEKFNQKDIKNFTDMNKQMINNLTELFVYEVAYL